MAAQVISEIQLTSKKNTKSPVWQYFALRTNEEGGVIKQDVDKPVCKTCGKSVNAKSSNTTNLFQHLREHHPSLYAEVTPSVLKKKDGTTNQPTLSDIVAKSSKFSSNSLQVKELNRAVTFYLAKDAVPLFTVDRPGFRHMVAKLNPRYQLPSRRHFT